MKRYIFLFLVFYVARSEQLLAQYEGKLGIVMGSVESDGFVDRVKAALPWDHGSTDHPLAGDELDSLMWPKKNFRMVLMDNRPVAEWDNGTIDDPEKYRVDYSGTYQGSFNGLAVINNLAGPWHIANQAYDSATNTTTFELVIDPPGPDHGLVIMNFDQTRRTYSYGVNTGITNLKIFRPGYENREDHFFSDQLFTALNAAGFSVIRDQGFTGTTSWPVIYPQQYEWSQRKLPDDPIQANAHDGKLEHVAWEHFIDLCNEVKKDIWINVPIAASEDYVMKLAQLLQARLDTALNIYVENDNEVWNSAPGFVGTYTYNLAQAEALGISDQENIARRAVRLSQVFGQVFGQPAINHRIRIILASHAPMLKWWVVPMLEYIRDHFGPPKNFIYAISRQTYFSSAHAATGLSSDQIIN